MMGSFMHYLVAAMIAWCPVAHHRGYLNGSGLTMDERDAYTTSRYESIASDVEEVAQEVEPLFGGKLGRVRTAVVVLSVASFESGEYQESVDNVRRSGTGNAHCIMQIEFPLRPGEAMSTRRDCIRIGIERIRESMHACPTHGLEEQLAVYARGKCNDAWGLNNSRMKMGRAMRWLSASPFMTLEGAE